MLDMWLQTTITDFVKEVYFVYFGVEIDNHEF